MWGLCDSIIIKDLGSGYAGFIELVSAILKKQRICPRALCKSPHNNTPPRATARWPWSLSPPRVYKAVDNQYKYIFPLALALSAIIKVKNHCFDLTQSTRLPPVTLGFALASLFGSRFVRFHNATVGAALLRRGVLLHKVGAICPQ